jgi:hypothetical protein
MSTLILKREIVAEEKSGPQGNRFHTQLYVKLCGFITVFNEWVPTGLLTKEQRAEWSDRLVLNARIAEHDRKEHLAAMTEDAIMSGEAKCVMCRDIKEIHTLDLMICCGESLTSQALCSLSALTEDSTSHLSQLLRISS